MDRLLELFDLTIAAHQHQKGKLKELTRLRELLCWSLLAEENEIDQSGRDLSRYFLYFNILARSSVK